MSLTIQHNMNIFILQFFLSPLSMIPPTRTPTEDIANFYYGPDHPCQTHRLRLAHQLIEAYNLFPHMDVFNPQLATEQQMTMFHGNDYIDFLKHVTPENRGDYPKELQKYNLGGDNPVVHDIWGYCQRYVGASLSAAYRLNRNLCDVAINWAGGAHHAKRYQAMGFNYVNDVVLAIVELLKFHQRVLYIDLDIHHGSGVEEAFYTTNRVYTVSFHKYGDFFPGTGHIDDVGYGAGENMALNIPLRSGLLDVQFQLLVREILPQICARYQPSCVVIQCGADGLAGDKLGTWNLTQKSHEYVIKMLSALNIPMLLLGGGGYNIPNTARLYASLTALVLNKELADSIPQHQYQEYYLPTCSLQIHPLQTMPIMNDLPYLRTLLEKVLKQVQKIENNIPHIVYTPIDLELEGRKLDKLLILPDGTHFNIFAADHPAIENDKTTQKQQQQEQQKQPQQDAMQDDMNNPPNNIALDDNLTKMQHQQNSTFTTMISAIPRHDDIIKDVVQKDVAAGQDFLNMLRGERLVLNHHKHEHQQLAMLSTLLSEEDKVYQAGLKERALEDGRMGLGDPLTSAKFRAKYEANTVDLLHTQNANISRARDVIHEKAKEIRDEQQRRQQPEMGQQPQQPQQQQQQQQNMTMHQSVEMKD